MLVTRGDRDVVQSVSKNPSARISYAGFRTLLKRSIGDDKLAILFGTRSDLPRQHFLRLVEQASANVRAKLLAENLADSGAVDSVVNEISSGLRQDAQNMSSKYAAALAKIETLHRAGKLGEADVYRFASEYRFAETAVALMLLCDVDSDIVERALLAAGSAILVILAKLAGFSWRTTEGDPLAQSRRSRHVGTGFGGGEGELRSAAVRHGTGYARPVSFAPRGREMTAR